MIFGCKDLLTQIGQSAGFWGGYFPLRRLSTSLGEGRKVPFGRGRRSAARRPGAGGDSGEHWIRVQGDAARQDRLGVPIIPVGRNYDVLSAFWRWLYLGAGHFCEGRPRAPSDPIVPGRSLL